MNVFEKNVFLNENSVVRIHLPNGKVIIISCNDKKDVKLICEDKEMRIQGGNGVLQKN